MPISEKAIEVMRKARWSEAYRWPVENHEEKIRALGHALHKAAHDFLSRYGGLIIVRKSPFWSDPTMCHTDPVEAAVRLHASYLPALEREAEAKLSPIGQDGYGCFVLVMDEEGRVYGIDDALKLCEFAESGEDWLEKLRFGGDPGYKIDWHAPGGPRIV